MANWKLGNLGSLQNLGEIIPSFLISKFSILPYSQNRKLGFKNLGKKFPSFPSFRPGLSRAPFLQNTCWRLLLFVIYLTVSFCKEVLYIYSSLLFLEKSTKTHNFAIFSFCFASTFDTLYCDCIYTLDQNISTRNHVSLMR